MTDFEGNAVEPQQQRITWDPIQAEKGGFKHFMLKEIYEQPRAVRDTSQGRVSLDTGKVYLDAMNISEEEFRSFASVKIAACGTSWHAGLAGKYMIESLARVPVDVDYASAFHSPARRLTRSPQCARQSRPDAKCSPSATFLAR